MSVGFGVYVGTEFLGLGRHRPPAGRLDTLLARSGQPQAGELLARSLDLGEGMAQKFERFALASRDRFFLCIEARDPIFDAAQARKFLDSLHPLSVAEVRPVASPHATNTSAAAV